MLKTENLCMSFDGAPVLKDVNFTLSDGEIICIMAPSGAGKTTLANIILGLIKPTSGRVIMPENTRFSCVFQSDRLLPQLNAVQNMRFVSPSLPQAEIDAALSALELQNDGEKPCAVLSGGQKRRAAIMRAMLAQSDVVILDEPFKGLDDAVREKAVAFIKSRQNGRSIMCITHDEADAAALGAKIFNLQ